MIQNSIIFILGVLMLMPLDDVALTDSTKFKTNFSLLQYSQFVGLVFAVTAIVRYWYTIDLLMSNVVLITFFMSYIGYRMAQRVKKSDVDFGFGWMFSSFVFVIIEVIYWVVK